MRLKQIVLAASVATLAGWGLAGAAGAQDPSGDEVLATVNGEEITRSDIATLYEQLPAQYRSMPLEVMMDPLVERVIDNRLLVAEAERRNLGDDAEVQAALDQARRDILGQVLISREVEEAVTEEQIQAAYEEAKAEPGFAREEVAAHHILLESEAEAKAVIDRLNAGEAFEEVAKELSTDPSVAQNAGDLGYFTRDMMVPEFADAAFEMAPGAISETPVQSQFGWHVIRLDDHRTVEPTLEEMQEQLQSDVARARIEELLAGLREEADIERTEAAAPEAPTAPASGSQQGG